MYYGHLEVENLAIPSIERQLTDAAIIFDNVIKELTTTKNKNSYSVESCTFHFRNKDVPNCTLCISLKNE